jgi:hypothetical protein
MYAPDRESLTDQNRIPFLPSWVTSARAEAPEYVSFLSGAALLHLHHAISLDEVPMNLVRDRLALRAAEVTVAFAGRHETATELRDAVHFLEPGNLPGPAGEIYLSWQRAVRRPVQANALHKGLGSVSSQLIAQSLAPKGRAPVEHAVSVLEECVSDDSIPVVAALILADAALARSLGWARILPVFALGLTTADLRKRDQSLRLACHQALQVAIIEILRHISECTRGVRDLAAVVPKLRARGAAGAVEVFLTQDAAAASALPLPDRAARRLCDRLTSLGVLRELSGRDSFRLYGV